MLTPKKIENDLNPHQLLICAVRYLHSDSSFPEVKHAIFVSVWC